MSKLLTLPHGQKMAYQTPLVEVTQLSSESFVMASVAAVIASDFGAPTYMTDEATNAIFN